MEYEEFYKWLITEKSMSIRAAKDVLSRCRRICTFLHADIIDEKTVSDLNSNEDFNKQSMFIKSQLRRAATLWNEYRGA